MQRNLLPSLLAFMITLPVLAAPIAFDKGVTLQNGDWMWRLKTSCPVKGYLYLPLVTADFYARAYIIRHGQNELVALKGPEKLIDHHGVNFQQLDHLAPADRSSAPGK